MGLVSVALARKATLAGDGVEYFSMLESLWRHGSPEQRPDDAEAVVRLLGAHGFTGLRPDAGFFATEGGRFYSYHFFVVPLVALPAKAILHLLGGDGFSAFAWTNAALLTATAAWALRGRHARRPERLALVVLASVGPVFFYVAWPHGEVFTWACVVTSVVSLDERRPARAALFAALGSLQAPPAVALAALAVGFAIAGGGPRRVLVRRVVATLAASSIAAAAPLFYLAKFGVPSLIAGVGMAEGRLASARRVASLAFDLDQGMLPYAPATLLLGLAGLAAGLLGRLARRGARRGRARALAVVATAIAMMAGASSTTNFNAGCAGMNRYDVWILPLFAWLAADHLPWARWAWRSSGARSRGGARRPVVTVGALVAAQLAITVLVWSPRRVDDAHEHNLLARVVLTHAPSLYTPEPEIFAERTLEKGFDLPWRGPPLPVAFFGPEGATKILSDGESLDALADRFDADPSWLAATRARHGRRRDLFYLEPPRGAVRQRGCPCENERVAFLDGWYDPESLGAERWRWMSRRASIVVRAAHDLARVVKLAGWVPEELGRSPMLTVSIDGSVVDRFPAPRHRFVRAYPLAEHARRQARVTIETSDVVAPPADARALGFALLQAEVTTAPRSFGGPHVHFAESGWGPTFGPEAAESRCMESAAEVRLDPIPGGGRRGELVVGAWMPTPEPPRPSRLRVLVDGAVAWSGAVHTRTRRRIAIEDVTRPHVVRFEPDAPVSSDMGRVAACIDVLRYGAAGGGPGEAGEAGD